MENLYNYCKVQTIGKDEHGEKIYGVVNTKYPNIGIPESWGDKLTAERYYVECILVVPYREYKRMKKSGYISAFRAKTA